MNTSYQESKYVSSHDIDKQVKRAERQQKNVYGIEIPPPTARKSVWELARKFALFFTTLAASATSKKNRPGKLRSN